MLKPVEKPIKFVKNLETKGKSYPITHVSAVIDDNGESIKSTIDSLKNKGSVTEVTWLELKDLRDTAQLKSGSLYRVTDYKCTTTQKNTRSAGHQFDIVLLALSENKLAEEGWAMEHPTDVYDVTFSDEVTKKCYYYRYQSGIDRHDVLVYIDTLLGLDYNSGTDDDLDNFINKTNKTINLSSTPITSELLNVPNLTYNYFQNSNLSAWKVWYCLDNDKSRFAWAQRHQEGSPACITRKKQTTVEMHEFVRNSEIDFIGVKKNYYGWTYDNINIFTDSETPSNGDSVYNAKESNYEGWKVASFNEGSPQIDEGKGVIYRLIDEFNNDIKYDFKNIQFKRKLTNGQYDATNGSETWCYTLNVWYNDMCQDASIVGNTLTNDEGYTQGVYDNVFGYATAYDLTIEGVDTFAFALGNNVVLSFDDGGYFGIHSNTIGNSFNGNTIGSNFYCNTIGNGFNSNTIGEYFSYNIIGNNFFGKTISDNTGYKNYGNNGVELATKS